MRSTIRVYFTGDVINEICLHCKNSKKTETGGILLGKKIISSDGVDTFIVLKTSGPGPKAVKTSIMFAPDVDYYNKLLISFYKKSKYEYLGEWHKHPAGFEETSYTDLNQVFKIFREERRQIMICPIITENYFKKRKKIYDGIKIDNENKRLFGREITDLRYNMKIFYMNNKMPYFELACGAVSHNNNALVRNNI